MLKDILSDSLCFTVLTGYLRIFKESIFTRGNNLKIYMISNARYDEFLGFINSDVDEMMKLYEPFFYKYMSRNWYNGDCFGDVEAYNLGML